MNLCGRKLSKAAKAKGVLSLLFTLFVVTVFTVLVALRTRHADMVFPKFIWQTSEKFALPESLEEIPKSIRQTSETYALPESLEVIPKFIWQTSEKYALPESLEASITSWRELNSLWAYGFMDDGAAEAFIMKNFDKRTRAAYSAFPLGVMKVRVPLSHFTSKLNSGSLLRLPSV